MLLATMSLPMLAIASRLAWLTGRGEKRRGLCGSDTSIVKVVRCVSASGFSPALKVANYLKQIARSWNTCVAVNPSVRLHSSLPAACEVQIGTVALKGTTGCVAIAPEKWTRGPQASLGHSCPAKRSMQTSRNAEPKGSTSHKVGSALAR